MTDRPTTGFDDATLEGALRALSASIDWPTSAPTTGPGVPTGLDLAARVRIRLADHGRRRTGLPWTLRGWRPVRRSVVLALAALLVLAVIAGAAGLGLPRLRFLFGDGPRPQPSPTLSPPASSQPTASPTPTASGALGRGLHLGELVALAAVETRTGIPVRLPTDARLGPPTAVWIDPDRHDQVAYVWASSASLPETLEPGIGLILMRFDGTVDPGFYEKLIGTGTSLERVKVDGHDGYWIAGDPHFFYYVLTGDVAVDESRRWVGQALVWSDGTTTFRIESALGKAATIEIAESIR